MTATEPSVDVSDVDVRAEIVEALMHHNRAAMRCPRHWVERLTGIHARMNDLLTQLEEWDATHPTRDGQATAPDA